VYPLRKSRRFSHPTIASGYARHRVHARKGRRPCQFHHRNGLRVCQAVSTSDCMRVPFVAGCPAWVQGVCVCPGRKAAWIYRGRSAERPIRARSEEHTSELQSRENLVCRLLLEKKKPIK